MSKQQKLILGMVVAGFFIVFTVSTAQTEGLDAVGSIDVYFSPHGGATDAVVKEIGYARSEILVQAYSFTSEPIAEALIDARKRGVEVVVVLDKSQRSEKHTVADTVAAAGIATYIDPKHAIAHNKIMVIDRETVITGSFNFTKAAEDKNAENLLVFKNNKPLAGIYFKNFMVHGKHVEKFLQ